jgi:AraC-like DNA-binding protein
LAFTIDDPDAIARLAEIGLGAAANSLRPIGAVTAASDWPDRLAADLVSVPDQRLGRWADRAGLAAETISRGFRSAFGVAPARFRAEVRARRAMTMIEQADLSLATIAADCGYSDQPHLNRAIVALTGRSPGQWRRSNSFKSSGGVSN